MDLHWLSIADAHKGLLKKDFSSEELTQACLQQIKATDKKLNNFVTVTEELALEQARTVDKKIVQGGEIGVLEGVPAAMKDIFNTKGVRTTCSSKMLEDFVPPYESTATQKLKDEGYVLLGKVNLDEFACGASTENSAFGASLNPWDPAYVAGGSSGGSASSVAAGQAFYSLGTDTGGSIRLPSSFSGVVGMKVTYGRVSRFGVTAMASSWDTIGPITRTVEDAALVLQAIAGQDPYDSTTPDVPVPSYTENLKKGVKGLKIGVPAEYFAEGVTEEVKNGVNAALKEYEKMGAEIVPMSLPLTKYGVAIYYVTMPGELSTNLARFDGLRFGHKPEGVMDDLNDYYKKVRSEGFGPEIKRRIMVGTFVLSAGNADAYYKQAQRARTLVIAEFAEAFKKVDVLIAPVSPTTAFKVGEKASDPLAMYLADALAIPGSAAGLPALAVPCGFSKDGLPLGFQVMGPHWSEALVLQVGAAYEQATEWHKKHPAL